jgi:hypothetical protein
VRAVELIHELNARVDWTVNQPTSIGGYATDQHRARPAIAFAADDLRARQPERASQEITQRQKNITATDFVAPPIQIDENMIQHDEEKQNPGLRLQFHIIAHMTRKSKKSRQRSVTL